MKLFILLATVSQKPEELSLPTVLFKTFLLTGFIVLLAILFIKYVIPKISLPRNSQKSSIQILDRQTLDGRKSIYIVSIDQKKLALGVTDHQISTLCELESKKNEETI